ncbi:hypothetical protein JTE90_008337 [Oedothorax gibbosus]|uniref:Uncharacterized protein n=1 Tax=Oedothorax gibbosus TaxID=931172 RepID=A0AAV6TZZ3_9ARAC|nr:hypothetical protein JTE90_008337 [Oedothorax gibbosus]
MTSVPEVAWEQIHMDHAGPVDGQLGIRSSSSWTLSQNGSRFFQFQALPVQLPLQCCETCLLVLVYLKAWYA